MPRRSVARWTLAVLFLVSSLRPSPLAAQDAATSGSVVETPPLAVTETETETMDPPPTFFDAFTAHLVEGEFRLNLRFLSEIADQRGLGFSEAYTSRLQLGYGTKEWMGLSAYAELEDVRTPNDDTYNAAGLNRQAGKTVIADVPGTELNKLFVRFRPTEEYAEIARRLLPDTTVGRQRIDLDDARFIGNVIWRQNEQTYDAATAKLDFGLEGLELLYSHIWEVNRIFGQDSGRDFESNIHVLHGTYQVADWFRPTAFGYFLDLHNAPALSTNTFGVRAEGSAALAERVDLAYVGSYAFQQDAADNPARFDAPYWFAEIKTVLDKRHDAGAGYEQLGAGNGATSFSTPLATLHKFNGFADVFLTTPTNGLEDIYGFVGISLPFGIKTRAWYHVFYEDQGGSQLGHEFDAVVLKKLNEHISVLVKYAWFDGDAGLADIYRLDFALEINI